MIRLNSQGGGSGGLNGFDLWRFRKTVSESFNVNFKGRVKTEV